MTTQTQNNGQRKMPPQGDVAGVIKIVQQGQLPQEFITTGNTFRAALGKCTIRDTEQRNAIIAYKAQLELFGMEQEIDDLTDWLNASSAEGGFNKSLAAMVGTGIYVPEGAGIKISKENQKALLELQKQRAMSGKQNENHDNQQQQ